MLNTITKENPYKIQHDPFFTHDPTPPFTFKAREALLHVIANYQLQHASHISAQPQKEKET